MAENPGGMLQSVKFKLTESEIKKITKKYNELHL